MFNSNSNIELIIVFFYSKYSIFTMKYNFIIIVKIIKLNQILLTNNK